MSVVLTHRDMLAAARRIAGQVERTPLVRSRWLSSLANGDVWLKLETAQRTGSFKIRGAANAVARLRQMHPSIASVTTASAGNHGLALATAGAAAGLAVRVHLPMSAPASKRDGLARAGATLVEAATYDAAEARAHAEVREGGGTFVSAYSDSDVIAGAGTIALEMLDDEPLLDTFIVPLGGGGLLSGTAVVVRARAPRAQIFGAEAAASPVFAAALAAGRPVTVDVQTTVADGLAGNMEPASQTFGLVRDLVDRVVDVPEAAIIAAMRDLEREDDVRAEGAAATANAALASGLIVAQKRRIGIIVSGGNR
jgi:threonine dehydratase